jgi:hypothetical protein
MSDELRCYIRVSRSCSNIRDATYLNVITECISDNKTGTTYPNVATEFISDIRTGTTYPNVAPEYNCDISVPILISDMNSDATLG